MVSIFFPKFSGMVPTVSIVPEKKRISSDTAILFSFQNSVNQVSLYLILSRLSAQNLQLLWPVGLCCVLEAFRAERRNTVPGLSFVNVLTVMIIYQTIEAIHVQIEYLDPFLDFTFVF
jgi:hypothetical protein